MKKIDLGQTITVLANLGVIAGILFLVLELRQNTVAVRSTASQGVQDQVTAIYDMLIDERMAGILSKGYEDAKTLDPTERMMFYAFWEAGFQAYQNLFYQTREGVIGPERTDGWWQHLRNNLEFPGVRVYWEQRRYMLTPEFQSFIETDVLTREPSPNFLIEP